MDYRYLILLSLVACDSGSDPFAEADVPTDQSRDEIYVPETNLSDSQTPDPWVEPTCPDDTVYDDLRCWPLGDRCSVPPPERAWRVTSMSYEPWWSDTGKLVFPGFDLNGDSFVDNRFGSAVYAAETLAGDDPAWDFQGALEAGLEGTHVPLVSLAPSGRGQTLTGWIALADDDRVTVRASSFHPGTAIPRARIELADMPGARGAYRNAFHIELPLAGVWLDLAVIDAHIEGSLYDDGTSHLVLGGTVPVRAIHDALNDAAAECTCIYEPLVDGQGKCTTRAECDEEDTCSRLVTFCGLTLGLLAPDVDLDGNGMKDVNDGTSMGLELTLEPTTIDGIEGCSTKEPVW